MKLHYFTGRAFQSESRKMLTELEHFRENHPLDFHPEHSALIVIDMQKYFLWQSSHAFVPSAPVIVPGLQRLIDKFKTHKLPVIYTRHMNTSHDAGSLSRWWEDVIQKDSPLSEIVESLDISGCREIVKTQYDAFHATDLERILAELKIRQTVITGVLTHLCCETTARSAFVRGFDVFIPVDGTATYNRQFHMGSLTNLAHGFAVPVLLSELLEFFD